MKHNYSHYRFSKKELIRYLGESLFLCAGINYLCYRSWWAFLALLPVPWFYLKLKRQKLLKRKRKLLNYAFKDAVNSLSVALKAGYSMENAISECIRDLKNIYPASDPIVEEFCYIQNQLKVSVPVETLLRDLGERSQVEDIRNFAGVYGIAKRSGGNLSRILQNTARTLNDKIEVEKEVEACIAAKRMEQSIMAAVPFGIILYMQVIDPEFLSVLYGNMAGVCVMTVCLIGYALAFWMGRRIVRIEV
ncbi:MAG: type II secretion system F family protein [Ruminococcus sp.]|jgi:tight adherence protein B